MNDMDPIPYYKEGCGCLVLLSVPMVVLVVLLTTSPQVARRFDQLLMGMQYALANPLCMAPTHYTYDPLRDEPNGFILTELPEAAVTEHLAGVEYRLEKVAVNHKRFPATAQVWAQVTRPGEGNRGLEYSLVAGQNLRFELEGLLSSETLCAYGLGTWRVTDVRIVSDEA